MALTKADLKQLQTEQLDVIATNRLTVLQSVEELNEMGGTDDHVASLRAIVLAYPKGITLAKVQTVLSDSVLLLAARTTLKEAGEIEEVSPDKGRGIVLKPLKIATK